MGKNWDDGGRNENSGQCVNSAIFGSNLGFFYGHVVCQNLSLKEAVVSFILVVVEGIPRQMGTVTAFLNCSTLLDPSLEGRLLVAVFL